MVTESYRYKQKYIFSLFAFAYAVRMLCVFVGACSILFDLSHKYVGEMVSLYVHILFF